MSGPISAVRGRRRAPALLAVFGAVLLATTSAQAAIVNFATVINGPQEPTPSLAIWVGNFQMDTDANTLSVNVFDTGAAPLSSAEIAAHIHGFSGPGVPSGILFGLPLGSPKNAVWNFLEAQQANIIAGLTYVNIHTVNFPGGEIRGQVLRVPGCGDGILDGGEACDDGNTDNGDCCDSLCQFEANGSACSGEGLCATDGECDGAGTCVTGPRGTCRTSLKSIILVKNDPVDDGKDKLLYKWLKGQATLQADFGVPTGTTNTALCVYSGTTGALLFQANVSADAGLWQPISDKGYKYKDPGGSDDGVQKVILKGGDAGKSKALLKGKGGGLPDPTISPSVDLPVVAELVNSANSICFGSTFGPEDVIKNDGVQFKAKDQ